MAKKDVVKGVNLGAFYAFTAVAMHGSEKGDPVMELGRNQAPLIVEKRPRSPKTPR